MGRVYSEELKDYETAKKYFDEAMQSNIGNVNTPRYYIECLLNNEDYQEAEKLIEFAIKLKGIDKSEIMNCMSLLQERNFEYKKALATLKEAKKFAYSRAALEALEEREKLVKGKVTRTRTVKKAE